MAKKHHFFDVVKKNRTEQFCSIRLGNRGFWRASQGQEEQINYQFLTVRGNFEEREELVQWVLERRPDAIIMESTGVYWKAIYLELEEAGLHPELINPRHFHSAEEGRKTDKTDAKWLANLARLGLDRASFVPEEPMRTLRLFVVATKKLVEGRKADKNRLTKILGKLFKNPCFQAELNKIVPFGFSLQRQKWCFFAIKMV